MYHKVILLGTVGSAPDMHYMPNGTAVTNFSLAVRQTRRKKEGQECPPGWEESRNGKNWEVTTWWGVTCWGRLAETVNEYLEKGRVVLVDGEVRGKCKDGRQMPRIWYDEDGNARSSYEIVASTVKFV